MMLVSKRYILPRFLFLASAFHGFDEFVPGRVLLEEAGHCRDRVLLAVLLAGPGLVRSSGPPARLLGGRHTWLAHQSSLPFVVYHFRECAAIGCDHRGSATGRSAQPASFSASSISCR